MSRQGCFRALARLLAGLALAASVGLVLAGRAGAEPPTRPNIVLIIADDLGWPDAGFMGSPYALTPNLDALAAGGTVFRQGQVTASVCAPSQRTLLAGVHSIEWDLKQAELIATVGGSGFRQEVVYFDTLPRELERQGYLSWEGGKMWMGTYFQAGFTHGLASAIGSGFSSIGDDFGRANWGTPEMLDPLRDFLDKVDTEPFLLWIAPALPHTPNNAPQEFREPYEQMGLLWYEVDYYAQVSWLDAFVGELLAELENRGEREDTLFVFLSDNGWELGSSPGFGKGKGTIHEMGHRTPIVFHWPGHVPAGVTRDDLVSSLDLLPTLLDFAGTQAAHGYRGASLKSAIETNTPFVRDKLVTFHDGSNTPDGSGYWVRTPTWRYNKFDDGREELYEIAIDPYEDSEVSAAHPELLDEFRADVAEFQSELQTGPDVLAACGRLTNSAGDPIAGAELQLYGVSAEAEHIALRSVTAVDGHFRFDPVPRGTYSISAGRRVSHLSLGPTRDRIPLDLPVGPLSSYMELRGENNSDLGVANTSTIFGKVQSSTGDPIEGATLKVRGKADALVRAVVRTDPGGAFRIENLPPGSYRVKASPPQGYRKTAAAIELGASTDLEQILIVAKSGGG